MSNSSEENDNTLSDDFTTDKTTEEEVDGEGEGLAFIALAPESISKYGIHTEDQVRLPSYRPSDTSSVTPEVVPQTQGPANQPPLEPLHPILTPMSAQPVPSSMPQTQWPLNLPYLYFAPQIHINIPGHVSAHGLDQHFNEYIRSPPVPGAAAVGGGSGGPSPDDIQTLLNRMSRAEIETLIARLGGPQGIAELEQHIAQTRGSQSSDPTPGTSAHGSAQTTHSVANTSTANTSRIELSDLLSPVGGLNQSSAAQSADIQMNDLSVPMEPSPTPQPLSAPLESSSSSAPSLEGLQPLLSDTNDKIYTNRDLDALQKKINARVDQSIKDLKDTGRKRSSNASKTQTKRQKPNQSESKEV